MNKKPQDFIEDAAQVVEYYGYWATFHDATIVSLSIMPEAETITATFEYNDMTDDKSLSGLSRITLQWQNVVKYMLQAEYMDDNEDYIYEVSFAEKENWIETTIVPIYGINGTIRSRSVRVTHFEPSSQ